MPPGQIPAITEPTYVSGEEAGAQMLDHEPVLAVVINGKARAYSPWQLDAHEIVNDRMSSSAFAGSPAIPALDFRGSGIWNRTGRYWIIRQPAGWRGK